MKFYQKKSFSKRCKITAELLIVTLYILYSTTVFSNGFNCPIPKNTFENLSDMGFDQSSPEIFPPEKPFISHRWEPFRPYKSMHPRRGWL